MKSTVWKASADYRLGRFIKGGVFSVGVIGGIAGEILLINTSQHTGKLSPRAATFPLESGVSTTRLHLAMVWASNHTTACQPNQVRRPMRFIRASFVRRWRPTVMEQFVFPSSQMSRLTVGTMIV